MRIINFMPEELRERAVTVLSERDALDDALKLIITEIAKQRLHVVKLWKDARDELENQGVKIEPNEKVGFDILTKEFSLNRRSK
jgi:NADPH-dependent glutamate synthase beta subunit-like oxidoreductase